MISSGLRLTHRWSAALIVLIGAVAYVPLYQTIIFSDDWSYLVMPMAQRTLTWFNAADRRPLVNAPAALLDAIVGVNVDVWYVLAWLVTVSLALLIYWVMQRLLPARLRYVALLSAALALVYPADLSKMWLTHTLLGRVAWLMTLVAMNALISFVQRRQWRYLVLATALAVFAPLFYEAALGVLMALCVLLALAKRQPWVLLPAGLNAAYMLWRSLGYNLVGIDDPYLTEITLDPGQLLNRLILGLKSLLWGWTEPVRNWLALPNNGLAGALIVAAIILLWVVGWLLTRRWLTRSANGTSRREWLTLLGLGLAFACAGYFPILILYEPNLDSVQSRVNLWAIPGAALSIVAFLALVARWLTRDHLPRLQWFVGSAVAVLLSIGLATQLTVRAEAATAWREQTHVWQDLFELAPQLADGAAVYFVLPGYNDRVGYVNTGRLPLSNSWEATAALNVLYDRTTLHGDVVLPDTGGVAEPELTPTGVRDFVTGRLIPYSATVFVRYAGTPRHLRLVTDLSSELGLAWPTPDYAPARLISPTAPPPIELRRLVATGAPARSTVLNGD